MGGARARERVNAGTAASMGVEFSIGTSLSEANKTAPNTTRYEDL